MVANQRVQKEMHVVVHVGELERVRERVDATRDKPHRQATATRSARQPDPGAVLSSSASSAVRILSSGAKAMCGGLALSRFHSEPALSHVHEPHRRPPTAHAQGKHGNMRMRVRPQSDTA